MVRLGSKGFYGLLAVAELVQGWARGEPIQVKDIARKQGIPADYLGQIMVALRKANVVRALRGPGGGYILSRNPDLISVAQVLEVLEGPVVSNGLIEKTREKAQSQFVRNISRVCKEAAEASLKVLESTPLTMIVANSGKEPMFYI